MGKNVACIRLIGCGWTLKTVAVAHKFLVVLVNDGKVNADVQIGSDREREFGIHQADVLQELDVQSRRQGVDNHAGGWANKRNPQQQTKRW